MLTATFLHCQGVGEVTERDLWGSGVRSWSDFLERSEHGLPPRARSPLIREHVAESAERLAARDGAWFARMLRPAHHWRVYPELGRRIAYLDIETTGGYGPGDLTVVGLYDGLRVRQFVKGDNLDEFPEALAGVELIVTFFGTGFDLPFLRRAFRMEFPQPHVDLCFALKRLGYRGGLKSVERQFGIRRSNETEGLTGMDAVRLWAEYQRGNEAALHTLLSYNAEDITSLETLWLAAYPRLVEHCGAPS